MRPSSHGALALILAVYACGGMPAQAARTFLVDCDSAPASAAGAGMTTLHSLAAVNALKLEKGDRILLERGTTCSGSLSLSGSSFAIGAHGAGRLPRIHAGPQDTAALSIENSDHILVEDLELEGGTIYGIHITGDRPDMDGITLRDLRIHGVHGVLNNKASGLVVIAPSKSGGAFSRVVVDGVRASNTTQWAGIFLDGVAHGSVENSMVHDVQGDGIVIFESSDARIAHSAAWHIGMQPKETIGTPNAIWTWRCSHCMVEDNEAFLTDSPGVDGGAFDIDWGNTDNTVQKNFAHDTQGYCVSIFGAFGPTVHSVVDGNLCLKNGLSPRLAERQGAIYLATWQGGSLDDVLITNNHVVWHPAGKTPAVQAGAGLKLQHFQMRGNSIQSISGFISESLPGVMTGNHYQKEGAGSASMQGAEPPRLNRTDGGTGWILRACITGEANRQQRRLLVRLAVAAVEYRSTGLTVSLEAPAEILRLAGDFGLETDGIRLIEQRSGACGVQTLQLVAPNGQTMGSWNRPPSAIDLGLSLRNNLGAPDYGALPFGPRIEVN